MSAYLKWAQSLLLSVAPALTACTDSPPPLGSHLPGVFKEASNAFDQRVKERFAIGTHEGTLRRELARERFVVARDPKSPFSFTATYIANELVCRADWHIRWSEFAGRIATIDADYGEICL